MHLPPGWKAELRGADNYLDTPLHIAASRGDLALVRLLVAGGADACAKNRLNVSRTVPCVSPHAP